MVRGCPLPGTRRFKCAPLQSRSYLDSLPVQRSTLTRYEVFIHQAQFSTGRRIFVVTMLSLMMLFRLAWASDQNVHDASQSLSLAEFVQNHGHIHPSSLDHLHVSTVEMTDQDHLLLHAIGAVEKHVPLKLDAVPLFHRQDKPVLQRTPSPLPEQTSALYRPPKA